MRRFAAWVAKPDVQLRLWGAWTIIWIILLPITLITALKISIEWIVFMSLFANMASCGTAWVAALSYHRARKIDEANTNARLDHIIEHHPDIPPMPVKDM